MKKFKTTENLEEKIKVTSLEIIVTGSKEKPYFEIKYKELGKEDYDIGYSSYDLNNVFTWKDECFDIVNELAEEYKVSEMPTGWIPCSERLPDDFMSFEYLTIKNGHTLATISFYCVANKKWYLSRNSTKEIDVIAWQPLPAPYTEGEAELYRAKSVDGEYQEYKGDWK